MFVITMWPGEFQQKIELLLPPIDNYKIQCFRYSGAEDMHAYVWDRYYGICLAKYQHTDVVNSVAFNPRDSEMLVTTSDDYTIKVNA